MKKQAPWLWNKHESKFKTVDGIAFIRQFDGSWIEVWKLELDGLLPSGRTDNERFYTN